MDKQNCKLIGINKIISISIPTAGHLHFTRFLSPPFPLHVKLLIYWMLLQKRLNILKLWPARDLAVVVQLPCALSHETVFYDSGSRDWLVLTQFWF